MNASKNPFGDKNPFERPSGPPDGDELREFIVANRSTIGMIALVLLAAVLLYFSIFKVESEYVGLRTTLGKYDKTLEPGLHIRIPLFQQVYQLPAKRQLKQEFGFRTISSTTKSEYARSDLTLRESSMLTGDQNVAVVEWIVHYQISDPFKYLFVIREPENTLRALSESAMREIVGDYSVTEVLTLGREEILMHVKTKLSQMCQRFETGISIQRIELKDSAPPELVRPSFNEVNQAEQERDRMQNEALAQYNKEIPKAEGQARQTIEEARGYAVERTNKAKGDVARFVAIQKEYAQAPKVTRTRLYLETMNDVLSNTGKLMIVDESARGFTPLIMPGAGGPISAPSAAAAYTGGTR